MPPAGKLPPLRARTARANGMEFGLLEAGQAGPLALCLHGFPDTAHTWRHLLPALAEAGFRAVAPFTRGYAPSAVPDDGCYSIGALAADAVALHEVLGGDDQAVLIGHDWGAEAAYGAAAFAPERWHRVVTLAVPPLALDHVLFSDYEQLKLFFYIFFFRDPAVAVEEIVAAGGMAFIERLWRDWSPGYDAAEDLAQLRQSLQQPANLKAAIDYYRATGIAAAPGESGPYEAAEQAVWRQARAGDPAILYLHGRNDGCIRADLVRDAPRSLPPGSRLVIVEDAGHFLHLEQPTEVNRHIMAWLAG